MPPRKKPKNAAAGAEGQFQEHLQAQPRATSSPSDSLEENTRLTSPRTRSRTQKTDAPAAENDAGQGATDSKRRNVRRKYGGGGTTSADAAMDAAAGVQPSGLPAKARGAGRHNSDTAESDKVMEAVVKVFCVHTEPNYSLPWQRKRQYTSSSSGFLLPGRRILTNAHCVDHYTQVKVKRRGSDVKHVASVLSVGTECDIALLTVEDDKFWEGVEPVVFGQLPQLQDAVTVVGYPIGGDTMSVTSGVVSRIEVTAYMHGSSELLGIQIDAAINSGNSGGPAFNEAGECVGIAFQSLKHEDAENIGYIIPTPVIEHFLTDYARHGRYTGFPCLGVEWQKLENPDLRAALKMKPDQKGVLIRRVEPTSAVSEVLHQNDVLMSFDGVSIANDGTVPFRSGERISFSYLVSNKYTDEEAELVVLHDGQQHTVRVSLRAPVRLVPFHTKGLPPSYFIVAGLVFTTVTVPYLRSEYGKEYDFDAPVKLLDKMMHGMASHPDEQVVVLSQVLAAEVNLGYEEICNTQVAALNNQPVKNMADLVARVDACTEPFLCLDLEYNQKVVLDTAKAKAATPEILAVHCISHDRSPDLAKTATAATVRGLVEGGEAGGSAGGGAASAPAVTRTKTKQVADEKQVVKGMQPAEANGEVAPDPSAEAAADKQGKATKPSKRGRQGKSG